MKQSFKLLFFFAILLTVCCRSAERAEEERIKAFLSRPVNFDSTYCSDSVQRILSAPGPKILYYVASSDCLSCKFNSLRLWTTVRNHFDVPVLFVIETSEIRVVETRMDGIHLDIPVIFDTASCFRINNRMEDEITYAFLMNEGKPRLVGNPINRDKLWQEYEKKIVSLKTKM